jgi:3-isopropylmalate/(R)-2-methylmalate dehydratase small subunit
MAGRVFKLGDNISTDHIIPGRWFHLRSNLPELAKHTLEDVIPDFASQVKTGDFLVAGKNFGLGSSREHAPLVIKMCGIRAVLAKSVARIFFRNAINLGLPVLICPTDNINQDDKLEVDFSQYQISDFTSGEKIKFAPLPEAMMAILEEGGLVPYITKYGDFKI